MKGEESLLSLTYFYEDPGNQIHLKIHSLQAKEDA